MGMQQILFAYGGSGGGGGFQTETNTWESRVVALGGTVTSPDKALADALVVALKAGTYWSSLQYFLAFIGPDTVHHRVPLIDKLNVGAAGNTGFVDGDCDTATGLVNAAGSAKVFNTHVRPDALNGGATNAAGMGIYLRTWTNGSAVEPCGTYDAAAQRWVIDLRSGLEAFRWSDVSTAVPSTATAATAAHYYGQAASATDRKLARNGTVIASSTTNKSLGNVTAEILVAGCVDHVGAYTYTKGTYGAFYLTNGGLTNTDITNIHNDIGTYLITPTGR
ncbi:hypothetical protein LYSHEL_25540 [Lysobacter helvus]|uniref:Uncharacterized protein n=2 Tax=Lysobacteraceae TaxID=32033 RepID=A0ABM7Q7X7_9GAMM|nr:MULTISPECIES: hypothetical protein [Lysobacter]BCT93530.1 hypothetical protein LYSCAS_25540 [Lysobacter caseinilyticus]BCT96683.1 hypothetical protein LYSHEL_25540 [Lysobacter helvus]